MYPFQEFLFWLSILFILYFTFITTTLFLNRHKDNKNLNIINNELIKLGLEKKPSPSSTSFDSEVENIRNINKQINEINETIPNINKNRLKPYQKNESECYKIKEEKIKQKCLNNPEMASYQKLMETIKK